MLTGSQYKKAHSLKELNGFGVTLVTMTGVANVQDWTGDVNDPSLLFFEKDESLARDDWPLIGFGYHHEWEDSSPSMGRCTRPTPDCVGGDDFAQNFILHEAGYHINGFIVAENSDLRSGRGSVDSLGCNLIDEDDMKGAVWAGHGVGAKHGRAWTMHVFFAPETDLPMIATVDPWDRDGGDGWEFTVDSDAFYAQGDCSCSTEPAAQINTCPGDSGTTGVLNSEIDAIEIGSNTDSVPLRADTLSTGSLLTMLSWRSPLEQMGFRTDDEIQIVTTFGATWESVTVTNGLQFAAAWQNVQDLSVGQFFAIRYVRDGVSTWQWFQNK